MTPKQRKNRIITTCSLGLGFCARVKLPEGLGREGLLAGQAAD